MSGGSGVDPYYQKDPPRKESEKKKPDSQAPATSFGSLPKGSLNVEDARRLYFDEGLNLARVANRLRVSASAVWRAFQEKGWVSTKGTSFDENVRRLYFRERLSKSEIARILGTSWNKIDKVFRRNQWESIAPPTFADPEAARSLYEQGLTCKEIAKKLGVSPSTVKSYLKQLEVKKRSRAKYRTDEERLQGRRENARRGIQRVCDLQDQIFGKVCRLCGVDKSKRKLPIHRKDCMEHDFDQLWRISFLRTVNPEEWARTCTMCHPGAHWAHDEFGIEWPTVEALSIQKRTKDSESAPTSPARLEFSSAQPSPGSSVQPPDSRTVEEMRKDLFGDECYFCGPLPEDKRPVIHRKDGAKHAPDLLKSKDYLRQLNPNEWVALCQKHHRLVHWVRDYLGLEWYDIETAYRKKKQSS